MARLLLGLIYLCLVTGWSQAYEWQTLFYKQPVDHFAFGNQDTYQQKYLVNNDNWGGEGSPIFFYAGNEGSIELFADNTGFMWDIAPEFKASLVFAEHRYYGQSLPYGNESYSETQKLGYLSSEQALADFAQLIAYLKTTWPGAGNSPVIAFGGSYGGMLAAWFRMKYPHILQGAIASSAPILQFTDVTPCNAFGQVVTADFSAPTPECSKSIRRSWDAINTLTATDAGKQSLSDSWKLCYPLVTSDDVVNLKYWLENVYGNLAMVNYPYPAEFLAPLPGYPINEVCKPLTDSTVDDQTLLARLFEGVSVYFNYTGTATCLDTGSQGTPALDDFGWYYQTCTEMTMPFCYDGVNDMFEPAIWDINEFSDGCYKQFGVRPRPYAAVIEYGAQNISAASNIVFSNGLMDPWSSGGIMHDISDTVVSVIIAEGAHHLDLRASDPADPPSVIEARNIEKEHIRRWIAQAVPQVPRKNNTEKKVLSKEFMSKLRTLSKKYGRVRFH